VNESESINLREVKELFSFHSARHFLSSLKFCYDRSSRERRK